MKRVIITSDDFGVTHSVNRGIVNGFNNGVLTSTNFMVPTPWFPEAFKLAIKNSLPVGIHLTLTCEWSNVKFGPITNSTSLKGKDGYFYSSYAELIKHMNIKEVECEYRAQIQKVIDMGIKPTHVDTHMMTPKYSSSEKKQRQIFESVRKVADEFGLIFTYDVENNKLRYFKEWFELTHKTMDDLLTKLNSWEDGDLHIICHCAYDTEEQRSIADSTEPVSAWASSCRQNDMDIITSTRLKDFLTDNDFKIIGIREYLNKKS